MKVLLTIFLLLITFSAHAGSPPPGAVKSSDPVVAIHAVHESHVAGDKEIVSEADKKTYHLDASAIIGAKNIKSVTLAKLPNSGRPALYVTLDEEGARRLEASTKKNIGAPLAIVIDGEVRSAPIVREAITGGQIMIDLGPDATPDEVLELQRRLTPVSP